MRRKRRAFSGDSSSRSCCIANTPATKRFTSLTIIPAEGHTPGTPSVSRAAIRADRCAVALSTVPTAPKDCRHSATGQPRSRRAAGFPTKSSICAVSPRRHLDCIRRHRKAIVLIERSEARHPLNLRPSDLATRFCVRLPFGPPSTRALPKLLLTRLSY
jgi:hypothetical protein